MLGIELFGQECDISTSGGNVIQRRAVRPENENRWKWMMKMHVSHTEITIQAVGIDEIVKVHGCRIKNDNPRGEEKHHGELHIYY